MAKNLKLTIKNTQIAEAINLGKLKSKIAKNAAPAESEETPAKKTTAKTPKAEIPENSTAPTQPTAPAKEEAAAPRIRARSRSAFSEGADSKSKLTIPSAQSEDEEQEEVAISKEAESIPKLKTSEELRKEIFAQELEELSDKPVKVELPSKPEHVDMNQPKAKENLLEREFKLPEAPKQEFTKSEKHPVTEKPSFVPHERKHHHPRPTQEFKNEAPRHEHAKPSSQAPHKQELKPFNSNRLGPTGRHVNDLLPKKAPPRHPSAPSQSQGGQERGSSDRSPRQQVNANQAVNTTDSTKPKFKPESKGDEDKKPQGQKAKEFKDIKAPRRSDGNNKSFDARDRLGLRTDDESSHWRKRKHKVAKQVQEDTTIRPSSLKIRTPISIKDLASEMKLKSSQLISKLFMQGLVVTLNDMLDDETTIQLLGHEFGCEITIDTSEEERIRITDKSVAEEIKEYPEDVLKIRAPIVAFMGHVDHGKTSLIDTIRNSNRASGEAGAITQHIGAFKCSTRVGDICILDTPGHEAFSAMRARGADVTDIVVLVVAGDEGMRQQTIEAMNHALEAKVTIVVAINKSDKPNFNPENVYRQLAEQNLLPEAWGGQTITVNCSAVTGEGIDTLLEMLALQAEVMELKANPEMRARGRVIESEMHKGMGAVATVLVQNGTLKLGDCLVFDQYWGRVKTMHDDHGKNIKEANPSTPVSITGLSGLPEAGQEFIVVKNEKEARDIAEARMTGMRQNSMLKKRLSMENLMLAASEPTKKILNLILRADVQGSLEALKVGLMKIVSKKAEVNIISAGVGEVSESDVQLASTSKAVILGFHTQIESHAEALIRQLGVQVKMHDIIYHAIDDITASLVDLLDKIAIETDKGKFTVKAVFKSSHHGLIAGGVVSDGSIQRNNHVRVKRNNEVIAKSPISSLKRVKEDVREVQKGLECGIVLSGFTTPQEGDVYESYEVTYITQEL